MSKGIPMLFYSPIPGQEEENVQYFTENGFGEEIQSIATIEAWFNKLLGDEYPLLLQNRISNHLNIKYSPQFCTESIIELFQL
jgi:processive 1,2-diacylglycerol beta-glucosyltransferase